MCRKTLFLLFSILVHSFITGSANASLLALYEFDGNAGDSAGANHGSKNGNPSYVSAVFGQVRKIDC